MASGRLRRQLKRTLFGLLALMSLWVWIGLSAVPGRATDVIVAEQRLTAGPRTAEVRLKDQPFYAELEAWRDRWERGFLGQVVDTNPRASLLKFYSAMARTGELVRSVEQNATSEPGWRWSAQSRRKIQEAERLFQSAVETIDASELPESIRENAREEAALKLKEILDYVLDHSEAPIEIPIKTENGFWRLPGSVIALASKLEDGADIPYYQFTQRTLDNVDEVYRFVLENRDQLDPSDANPFVTPRGYATYTYTPGYLVPPKVYLKLPQHIQTFLEFPLGEQSLLQVVLTLIVLGIYGPIVGFLLTHFLNTLRYNNAGIKQRKGLFWRQENTAWRRFLLIAPIAPLSIISTNLIDNKINITGWWLRQIDFCFDLLAYIAFGAMVVLLCEALGRTGSHWVLNFRRSSSALERKRIENLLLPFCRFLGAMTAVIVIYQLLLRLGMPSSTVLAFSAVPGLAIGLGASKLLGNIFAGISIQSDRPVRVGEFCQVGDKLGFVKRIGLRSIELSTLSANVTIPNNKVDDTTIVNFTRRTLRSQSGEERPILSIDFDLRLPSDLGIGQLNAITERCSAYLEALDDVSTHSASYHENPNGVISLTVLAEVHISSWEEYLSIKQSILSDIKRIIAFVGKLKQSISIARDTPLTLIDRVPALIAEVVNRNDGLSLNVCRLSAISDYSIDFIVLVESSYGNIGDLLNALARVNRDILASFAAHGIEIPLPTSVEIQKATP
ncbi:MAG: mechanosensitive ion channel family protein [Synechococcus sp.]